MRPLHVDSQAVKLVTELRMTMMIDDDTNDCRPKRKEEAQGKAKAAQFPRCVLLAFHARRGASRDVSHGCARAMVIMTFADWLGPSLPTPPSGTLRFSSTVWTSHCRSS